MGFGNRLFCSLRYQPQNTFVNATAMDVEALHFEMVPFQDAQTFNVATAVTLVCVKQTIDVNLTAQKGTILRAIQVGGLN
jgi:hypothetical protein